MRPFHGLLGQQGVCWLQFSRVWGRDEGILCYQPCRQWCDDECLMRIVQFHNQNRCLVGKLYHTASRSFETVSNKGFPTQTPLDDAWKFYVIVSSTFELIYSYTAWNPIDRTWCVIVLLVKWSCQWRGTDTSYDALHVIELDVRPGVEQGYEKNDFFKKKMIKIDFHLKSI